MPTAVDEIWHDHGCRYSPVSHKISDRSEKVYVPDFSEREGHESLC